MDLSIRKATGHFDENSFRGDVEVHVRVRFQEVEQTALLKSLDEK